MEILSIKIKNFMAISALELKPGKLNQFVGKNNQGKTSALKAMDFLAHGEANPSLVKVGETEAEVLFEFVDGLQISRTLSAETGKQKLTVKTSAGFKAQSPQTMVDQIFSEGAFKALSLIDPKKRSASILASIPMKVEKAELAKELGIDVKAMPEVDYNDHGLKALEQVHKYFYHKRTDANKDADDKLKTWQVNQAQLPPKPEERDIDVEATAKAIADLQENKGLLQGQVREADYTVDNLERAKGRVHGLEEEIEKINSAIADLNKEIEMKQFTLKTNQELLLAAQEAVRLAKEKVIDKTSVEKEISDINTKIADLNADLTYVENCKSVQNQYRMVDEQKAEADRFAEKAKNIDTVVKKIAGPVKAKLMESVEMPVPGLTYLKGEFQLDGVNIDNLSTSKTIQLAIGVAKKLAGKTKLICMDGFEQLDEETFAEFQKQIEGDDFKYFVTKVGEAFSGDSTVVKMERGNASTNPV